MPGEQVLFFGDCARKVRDSFEGVTLAVTPQRLLLAGSVLPFGYKVKFAAGLASCSLANGKERADGSRLLILRHPAGPICLFFTREHAEEAEALVVAIGHAQPRPLTVVKGPPLVGDGAEAAFAQAAPPVPATAPVSPVLLPPDNDGDQFGFGVDFGQELHAISQAAMDEDDDEDY